MKKFISAISALGFFIPCSIFCAATTYAMENNNANIMVITDGAETNYQVKWNDSHSRLMISSDYVEGCFNAPVQIIDDTIQITGDGHTLSFQAGNEYYVMDGLGGRKTDCPPQIIDGKAYLPLRYICEAFGADVKFDIITNTVSITKNTAVISDDVKKCLNGVQVFDQASIKFTGEKTVYVDPRRIMGEPHDADIIFITHTHGDHYEIDSIKKVAKPSTIVYITQDGVEQAKTDGLANVIGVQPNMDYSAEALSFSTVSAYNTAEDRQNHKSEYNWVGYIFELNGYTYYCAGDTDFTEEMKNLNKAIDVAFLPIDGKYNMDAREAANAANAITPRVAVPYHYNNFVPEDKAREFVSLLKPEVSGAVLTFKLQ